MKIWYQSYTDWDLHEPYLRRLDAYLKDIAGPDTSYDLVGMKPADLHVHRLSEIRCANQMVLNALAAQERGFDAVIIGHFQDSGLADARSVLDIPVIGLGEASMLHAMQLGRTFGLVTIDPLFSWWHRDQTSRLGLERQLVGVNAISTPPSDLIAAFEDPDEYARILERFRQAAQPLVDAGAELIVPAGGLFALMSAAEWEFNVSGAVVLNPIPVAVRAAETAVWLRAHNGTAASRVGTYAKPPTAAVEEFRLSFRSHSDP